MRDADRYRTGLRAESLAAWYLRLKGYRVVARRMKTPLGEIDLVVRRGNLVVFVEVKARATVDAALESVQPRQAQRIVRASQYYLSGHRGPLPDLRFDIVAVSPGFRIRHIKSAFSA